MIMDEPRTSSFSPAPATPELVRASTRARLVLGASIVLMLVFLEFLQLLGLPWLISRMESSPIGHTIFVLKLIFITITAIAVIFTGILIWYGRRILRFGQFPLPGAWVLRDTLVKRGSAAATIAWLHVASGALIGVIFIVLLALLWNGLSQLERRPKLPPGISILPPGAKIPGYQPAPPAPATVK
ncbi:hypothetical protein BH11PSE11_BH11PSE11_25630 [soil metagenome]